MQMLVTVLVILLCDNVLFYCVFLHTANDCLELLKGVFDWAGALRIGEKQPDCVQSELAGADDFLVLFHFNFRFLT